MKDGKCASFLRRSRFFSGRERTRTSAQPDAGRHQGSRGMLGRPLEEIRGMPKSSKKVLSELKKYIDVHLSYGNVLV